MPEAVAVSIAQAVTAQIQTAYDASEFAQEFTLERSYADWDLALDADTDLRVDVCLVTTRQETELSQRGGKIKYVVPVDIAIRQKFGKDKQDDDTGRIPNEIIDPLMLLVQQVHTLFTPVRLTDFAAGSWQQTRVVVAPLIKHLRENRQFTAIVRTTFHAHE